MTRLVLLRTSSRVAPGQLTAPAWDLLRAAAVVAAMPGHPQGDALAEADIEVRRPPAGVSDAVAVASWLIELSASVGTDRDAVVWLCGPEGDPELDAALVDRAAVLTGSVDLPGAAFVDLVAVMDRLRSPGGCPWDAAQTHATLVPYLLEEAYEAVEAVEAGDRTALREELGDVLLQVVFHARVAQEHPGQPWDVDEVARGIEAKLVARHPHVFGDAVARTPAQVEASWEALKRKEKGRTSAVDGVPLAQPALALTAKLIGRAERAGVQPALPTVTDDPRDADQLGDLLLVTVARARARGLDPEAALRAAARRYAAAVRAREEATPPG